MASTGENKDSEQNMNTPFKPVTHVIFDMDGLLLDTEDIDKRIVSEIFASYGKEYTQEIQLKVLGTTEQDTASIILNETQIPLTREEYFDVLKEKQDRALGSAQLLPGVERLIKHLHANKIPIAVATSSGDASIKLKTSNHLDIFNLFDHIVSGSSDVEVKQGKPAPDIFRVCADRFADKPSYEKCLVFEDSPNGVTGAVAAGMQCVMVPEQYLPKERTTHATLVLNSLLDFQPELFGLPPFQV